MLEQEGEDPYVFEKTSQRTRGRNERALNPERRVCMRVTLPQSRQAGWFRKNERSGHHQRGCL